MYVLMINSKIVHTAHSEDSVIHELDLLLGGGGVLMDDFVNKFDPGPGAENEEIIVSSETIFDITSDGEVLHIFDEKSKKPVVIGLTVVDESDFFEV